MDIVQAIQRRLPDMPSFCRPLSKAEIKDVLTSLKGRSKDYVAKALAERWLAANDGQAACEQWYIRQQARFAKGG